MTDPSVWRFPLTSVMGQQIHTLPRPPPPLPRHLPFPHIPPLVLPPNLAINPPRCLRSMRLRNLGRDVIPVCVCERSTQPSVHDTHHGMYIYGRETGNRSPFVLILPTLSLYLNDRLFKPF